ncbi:N-acetylglucosamine kinase-like BadF-type ATPase [Streptomyces umbrinus]|uniref:N-acetylglucosamine kinase-like BadF-type ATPase n=1 Tax=Streptomyces umbrinus TaxID=67370 RepID=A0ABU0T7J3_9ACTN|nr:BadF/BadG/BcrA/BcrD ATPase family protein [Streptomyces umbrinus]MDQ1031783.1 N-acetylglucosamine kinase-like BadF-type ATPase [Streptomyces umbrinus]
MTRPGGTSGVSGVLAVDSGGSGLRVVLAVDGGPVTAPLASREPVRTGPRGIDAGHLLEQLVPMARRLTAGTGVEGLRAIAIGAAGLTTLGDSLRADLPSALARELGVRRLALVADAVTAYTGALGQRVGAVVAGGTGMIAIGTDLKSWRRADGWGHLLGDCGSGAWIGRAGLEAALRADDGRPGGSAALLSRAEEMFGSASALPGQLYPRSDRPAVLASFAPEVAACADDDPVASDILAAAARHIADSAAAVCPDEGPGEVHVALTGGLFKMGDPLLVPLRDALAKRLPYARQVPAAGDPLDGAVRIAVDLADDRLTLPRDESMLYVVTDTAEPPDPHRPTHSP